VIGILIELPLGAVELREEAQTLVIPRRGDEVEEGRDQVAIVIVWNLIGVQVGGLWWGL
jgi:hypothetical protein